MKLLFLDIDGVLNNHRPMKNGYVPLNPDKVRLLCLLLKLIPDLKIVLTSAWRYMILNKAVSLEGFEHILTLGGARYEDIHGRLIGCTECDSKTWGKVFGDGEGDPSYEALSAHGLDLRKRQIEDVVELYENNNENLSWVAVDDLYLEISNFVQTNGNEGITMKDIKTLYCKLMKDVELDPSKAFDWALNSITSDEYYPQGFAR